VKPDATLPSTPRADDQRRRVRLFVALHLAAVGAIYALALLAGGGHGGPPMPPPGAAPVTAQAAAAVRMPPTPGGPSITPTAPALPAWAQRVETAGPWESR
jgi:hypothetical protein